MNIADRGAARRISVARRAMHGLRHGIPAIVAHAEPLALGLDLVDAGVYPVFRDRLSPHLGDRALCPNRPKTAVLVGSCRTCPGDRPPKWLGCGARRRCGGIYCRCECHAAGENEHPQHGSRVCVQVDQYRRRAGFVTNGEVAGMLRPAIVDQYACDCPVIACADGAALVGPAATSGPAAGCWSW